MKKQFYSFYSGKILQKNYSFYSGKILQKKMFNEETVF